MPNERYSAPARLLHWAMAVLILAMIPVGLLMVQPGLDRGLQNSLFIFHKNAGVLLLILVVLRLGWRLMRPAPPLPATLPGWQARIAGASHLALYVLMFAVPVAGYVRVKAGGFPIETLDALGVPSLVPRSDALAEVAKAIHYGTGLAIAAVICAHVGAALFHGIVKRDGVFSRLWPPRGGGFR
jgi:cytochrome b561